MNGRGAGPGFPAPGGPAPLDAPLEDRLVVGERLAIGGMAEVFLGQLTDARGAVRDVVVKRMLPNIRENPTYVKRFIAEAQLAQQLVHPHIIRVLDVSLPAPGPPGASSGNGDLMMVMEAVDGADLATLIKRTRVRCEKMPLPIVLRIVRDVVSALAYAHDKRDERGAPLSIIHRDVTPSNVLIGRDGATKLIDFGIARAASLEHLTQSGYLVGKIHYLAPEQVRHADYDHRVDVWSAGVMLYQLLAGRRPFDGNTEPAVLLQVAHGERKDIRKLARLPEDLAAVVDRALAVDVKARFATATDFAAALDAVVAAHGLQAGPRELGALVDELVPAPTEATVHDAPRGVVKSTLSLALDDGRDDIADHGAANDAGDAGDGDGDAGAGATVDDDDDDDDSSSSGAFAARPEPTFIVDRAETTASRLADDVTVLPRASPTDVTRTTMAPLPAPATTSATSTTSARTSTTRPTATAVTRPRPPSRGKKPRRAPLFAALALGGSGVLAAGIVAAVFADDPAVTRPVATPTITEPIVALAPATTTTAPTTPTMVTPTTTPAATPTTTANTPTTTATPATPAPPETTTPGTTAAPRPPVDDDKRPDRPRVRKPRPDRESASPGEIVVDTRPWSSVTLDGVAAGVTPTVLRGVRPGRHTLVLQNEEQGLKKTVTVVVESDEIATVRVDLKR